VGASYIGLEFAQAFRRLGSKVSIIGRVPNTDLLNLESTGVRLNQRGYIEVNDAGQSSVPHIYALGDVNGKGAFSHTSVHDGQVFLAHMEGARRRISHRFPIHSMFIDPPLARVGMSQGEAEKSGKKVLMATREMQSISRAKEKDETKGLIKLLVEEGSNLILGCTIFGVGGDEIIGMVALAMQAGLPNLLIMMI